MFKSQWNEASHTTRALFCGAVAFWIWQICTWREHWDPIVELMLESSGMLSTLVFGLRERGPVAVVTSLGLNQPQPSQETEEIRPR